MPLQIFDARHPTASHNTIAEAIRYAVDNGAQVISASFGSATPSETLRTAVEYASQHNVILVSAVGNFRKNTDTEPTYPAHFGYPNQLTVGASERRDLASNFTNFGRRSVDIFAPGDEIISTELNGTYAIRSGTSQACPLVSGAVATAKYLYFNESSEQIIQRVLAAADALPGLEVFSKHALRLNVDNIVQNKKGIRWSKDNSANWKSISFRLESEHPYRSNISVMHMIEAPPHTQIFKIHFERFSTQSTDVFEIIDKNQKTILSLSGNLETFWSPEIVGNTAYVRFTTDRFVSDYGWTIDQIRYLE